MQMTSVTEPTCQSVHDAAFEGSRCLWKAGCYIKTTPSVHGIIAQC